MRIPQTCRRRHQRLISFVLVRAVFGSKLGQRRCCCETTRNVARGGKNLASFANTSSVIRQKDWNNKSTNPSAVRRSMNLTVTAPRRQRQRQRQLSTSEVSSCHCILHHQCDDVDETAAAAAAS
jgi:hypothetical protein